MLSNARRVPISEFCRTGSGTTPPRSNADAYYGGGIPWVKSGELREGEISKTEETVTELALRETPLKVAPAGALLVAMYGATVGRVGILKVPATTNQAICHIVPDPKVADGRYMFHALQHLAPYFVSRGAGGAQPNISQGLIQQTAVYLPPLDEQRRIAAILDQADALRRKRRHSLFMHEELVNALTRSVLGDPVTNDRQWSEGLELGSVADIASGVTKGRRLDGKSTRTVPYLAVANVQERYLSLGNVKEIEATESEIERYRLMRDDLLLTEGGDPDKLGRGALWRGEIPDAIHQNHVFRVRLTTKQLRPTYLSWLIGSSRGKQYFLKAAKQTTGIASINMGQLKRFPLLVPPLEVQDRFERLVQAGEAQRVSRQKSLAALDSLFVSLQHRAFNEEL